MSSQPLPDFDALWDYSQPDETEARFREILLQIPEDEPAFLELLTQIARAQGLQRKFEKAHQTLDQAERRLGTVASRPRVRYLLERGRVISSAGEPERARSCFEEALRDAQKLGEDFYAVDAVHMLAIISPPEQGLELNQRAIQMAESSEQEKARGWLGSLYNNMGWSYHNLGNYAAALETFEKAEAWQRAQGRVYETRIAQWCVARTLRSLELVEEALSKQMALKHAWEADGVERDGFVFEEIGECLLLLGRKGEARRYFSQAYQILKEDAWLAESEPERLARLKELGR